MNAKDQLYDAIRRFADGDEDVYSCLRKEIYTLTHTSNAVKFRSTIAMILFFTDHNKIIAEAVNNYASQKSLMV